MKLHWVTPVCLSWGGGKKRKKIFKWRGYGEHASLWCEATQSLELHMPTGVTESISETG